MDDKTTIYASKPYQQTGSERARWRWRAHQRRHRADRESGGQHGHPREQQRQNPFQPQGAPATYEGARIAFQAQDGRFKALYAVKAAVNFPGSRQAPLPTKAHGGSVNGHVAPASRNYQPMVKLTNCSKGCKVEGPAGGWVMWNGQPVHPVYKRQLEERQEAFRAVGNERIPVYRRTVE